MNSKWQKVQFKDLLAENTRNGLTKPKKIRGQGVNMISMKEIFANNRINDIDMEKVPVTNEEMRKFDIRKNDLLFARQSLVLEGAGKCCIINEITEPTVFESHLIRVRIDIQKANPHFIYYYFNSKIGKLHMQSIVEQVAAAGIRASDLINLYVPYPNVEIQNKISYILKSIDDKIELNNQINKNLEQQIDIIFHKYFYSDIKNSNENNCKPLGELITLVDNRGKTPPLEKMITEYPIIDVKALSGNNRIINYRNCTKYVNETTYKSWFRSGHPISYDIIISTVGTLAEIKLFFGNIGCIAQNVVALRSKKISPLYLYQYLKNIRKNIMAYDIGSVQPSIKVTHITNHLIYIPNETNLKDFDNISKDFTIKIYQNCMENENLIKLRDILLSKLMSGEIDVSEVEI